MAIAAPSGLTATAATAAKINLAWTNEDAYDTIAVSRKPDGGTYTVIKTITLPGTTYSDTTCEDGTKYYYKLRGFVDTEWSLFSNEANATTPLTTPSGMGGTSASGGTEAYLEWTDNSQNEASFKVYKNGSLIYTTAANAIAYTATGLSPGATYTFYVKAYNSTAGLSASSNVLSLTMDDPPAKPSGLTGTPLSTTSIRLNWTDNSDNETDFHMEESSTSGTAGFASIGTVGANVTTYPRTGLVSNTQYWYRVRAHNSSGYSAYCTVATAVTLAAIAAPTNLALTAAKVGGVYGVEVVFTDNSELEDGHEIWRKTGSGGTYAELVQLAPNRTYYHDTTAAAGTGYYYKVRADQGGSSWSAYGDEVSIAVPTAPARPTGLSVSEYQDTWARLAWTATTGEDGYSIEQSSNNVAFAEIMRVGPAVASVKVTGLAASTLYYWRVRAYNGAGYSDYSGV